MRYGPIVAKRYKKQYFRKRTGWKKYEDWPIQPEQYFLILRELKTKAAIIALLNKTWTRNLPRAK